jgi:predicted PurR-regulated permease PerM
MVNSGVTVVNILAGNVLSPVMISRGLSLSPTGVFWARLLGGQAPSWRCP